MLIQRHVLSEKLFAAFIAMSLMNPIAAGLCSALSDLGLGAFVYAAISFVSLGVGILSLHFQKDPTR